MTTERERLAARAQEALNFASGMDDDDRDALQEAVDALKAQPAPVDAELKAWRERFPMYEYRPQGDYIALAAQQQESGK